MKGLKIFLDANQNERQIKTKNGSWKMLLQQQETQLFSILRSGA